jgi:branched-chain amino acid aminotransferase
MKPSGFVSINGRIVAAGNARVSAFDRGLLYGDGLLETLRCYSSKPFALDRHIERLYASAAFLGIPIPKVDWNDTIDSLLKRNRLGRAQAWIRITLTRGCGERGLASPPRPSPTVLITAGRIDPSIASIQRRGVRLVPVPFGRDPVLAAHKTLNYLSGVLAKDIATRAGAYDALFTDDRGCVLETTTANIFVFKGAELWTPKKGILPGVTRALALDIARRQRIHVRESSFTLRELIRGDEAFLTSSLVEVVPLVGIADVRIGSGRPGPRTREMRARLVPRRRSGSS